MSNLKKPPTIEEAEAVIELGSCLVTNSYAGSLSALEGFYASQASTGEQAESISANGALPFFSGKPMYEEMFPEPRALLLDFEQATWDLYELQGTLDRTRLLLECQVRAQNGEDGAKRRLAVLDSFHRVRHKNRDYRRDRPVNEPPEVQAGERLWALLIGNNKYPQSPLQGAVNDSKAWESYLIDFHGVPNSNISVIQDADRNTMVTALYDLRDNPNIKEGDHILFAFSGHGSSFNAKRYSFEDDVSLRAGSIEAICPVDRGLPAGRGTPDISDRELLLILSDIHDQTKANITVVLDCCHSGGGSRELGDDDGGKYDRRSRGMAPLVDQKVIERMFAEADDHPRRRPSNLSVRSPAWASETVDIYRPALLAACQDNELAWEENMHGAFTSAIMDVLCSEKTDGLTCSGLIKTISPLRQGQQPRFDGKDSILFRIGT